MTSWFADSFYFFALLNTRDEHHDRAKVVAGSLSVRLVTTAWVLTELADGFCKPADRAMVAAFIRGLRSDPNVAVVPPDTGLFDAGLALYESRLDKAWSLTDCISFAAMRQSGLTEALTGDHHFEQAGFTALLK